LINKLTGDAGPRDAYTTRKRESEALDHLPDRVFKKVYERLYDSFA